MSLRPGQTLLHYEIVEKIGAGGMGEVYRANDRKLARDVAIKVLPPEVAGDGERLSRFEREAQVLASLNHPNIAAIYGLEEADDTRFLVLELIAGQDLAERLARGPVPVEQALDIARQIAEGLEAAHEQSIVHRDLKPANVKLTPEGKIKVLDFGLAKALDSGSSGELNSSLSPTITSASTRAGMILGTAAYMSPEQARGGPIDKRTDVWSFGCVMLELLTGRNPFVEDTITDTLASVLRSEPDWKQLPGTVTPGLRRLLRRCLDKDPTSRLRDIGEARIAISEILSGAASEADLALPSTSAATGRGGSLWKMWKIAAAVVLTAVVTTALIEMQRPEPETPVVRSFDAITGPFEHGGNLSPAISPDGQKVVFRRDGRLWVRHLDRLEPQPLKGTDGGEEPAWSPDSASVVFCTKDDLKIVNVGSGAITTVVPGFGGIDAASDLAWTTDGRIVYVDGDGDLAEVSARGGEPTVILEPLADEVDFHETSLLPDGSILLSVHREVQFGSDTLAVFSEGKRKDVLHIEGGSLSDAVYSTTGHIVFRRNQSRSGLWAVPFSVADLDVTGAPFLITSDAALPTVANDGTLLYVTGASHGQNELVWVKRDGTVDEAVSQAQPGLQSPALSPDGTRVAVMANENEAGNIWLHDIARKTRTRLSVGKGTDWDPMWAPDGKHLVYWDGGMRTLVRIAADGTGQPEDLVGRDFKDCGSPSIAPDGTTMAFWVQRDDGKDDLWMTPLDGDPMPRHILESRFREEFPRISPDGGLLAYVSDESGDKQIYLMRYPSGKGKWLVSADGGTYPVWSRAGDELFFIEGTSMKQVDVTVGSDIKLGTPATLFDAPEKGLLASSQVRFDVSLDGQRLLMVREIRDRETAPRIVVSYNWMAEFEQR